MMIDAIHRQYDEVIAPHYDLDPQTVIGRFLDKAVDQIRRQKLKVNGAPLQVLDLGMGTGKFFAKLRPALGRVQPFGVDISPKMIDIARGRIPDLTAEVEDASNFDALFPTYSFDLICTHFVTGFVPMSVLAPKIQGRLSDGGYWSFVGGTKAGFPTLQKKANGKLARWLFGGRGLGVDDLVCNPTGRAEVVEVLERHGFAVRRCETFAPSLDFRNWDEFMEFSYYGGWLTPFIESLGLHEVRPLTRALLSWLFFPVQDHHSIEIILAQKACKP